MFIGSIPAKLRQVFWQAATLLEGRDVYIGCSGNFTFEQIISRRCQNARLHSNDIALYTSMIGYALTDRKADIVIQDPEYTWLGEYLNRDGACQIASFLLFQEMLKFEKQNTDYKVRMWNHYVTNWERLLSLSMYRVNKGLAATRIEDYTTVDVFDYFPRPGGVCIGFLPTYVGGYERLYKRIAEVLLWVNEPPYAMLTDERREETIERMKQSDFILYDDNPRDDVPCIARLNQPGKHDVYIYSNMAFPHVLLRKNMEETAPKYHILGLDAEIPDDAPIRIVETDNKVLNHYRSMYLKKGITPASAGLVYMVFAGEQLLGFAAFQPYSPMGKAGCIYMMSDFVVRSRRHKRLAKLMLMITISAEMQLALQEKQITRYTHIYTTAFTKNPVSMKYRGIFKLAKRGDGFLNYSGEFAGDSTKDVVKRWKMRFEKQSKS